MTYLIILIGFNFTKVVVEKFLLIKALKNIAYVRLQEENIHQDFYILERKHIQKIHDLPGHPGWCQCN